MKQEPITAGLGQPLPPGDVHAVSVSLPKWQDTVGWANRDPSVLAHLQTGYPRFFIHRLVDKLAARLLHWARHETEWTRLSGMRSGKDGERPAQLAMLFPHVRLAWSCMEHLRGVEKDEPNRDATFAFEVNVAGDFEPVSSENAPSISGSFQSLCVVVYPDRLFKEAKAFWQHTGFGVSSRHAAYWFENASFLQKGMIPRENLSPLPLAAAKDAAHTIKQRISELFSSTSSPVQANDVVLYPNGMSAIASSASTLRALHRGSPEPFRVAVFGFLYVDTFKVLSKVNKFECRLYGHASSSDMDQLERHLHDGMRIHALYTEFPGNPLLRSPDLHRLHALSRQFRFHLVVDDTIGTAVNLDLAPFCDLICTSLTKMFSGACNVMGGSLTVCPGCQNREALRAALTSQHVDTYFPLDLIVMEKNSRDFAQRMALANKNAEAMADRLRRHPSVEDVFYPRGSATQHLYERYKKTRVEAGYGYLLCIRFVRPAAAVAFHDALELAKGPSLGTNFTLCCAYTLLAHAAELEWAAEFDVVEYLVRVSVGIEPRECLEQRIEVALEAAGDAS
ncbi:hypothetical protein EsDP_00007335 [Epichloe bromicola]|uniref:Cystathionine gamma-synthase n=1 Tax=Epichloe bromicola TaxID=79588 RepID=A0ABQ0D087_9HYPO